MMNTYLVERILSLGKGKYRVTFSNGISLVTYRTECKTYGITENAELSREEYERFITEGVAKRAIKRALHLLEQMDRSEARLREKLMDSEYPPVCIDMAIEYVKSYHYLDDHRYACTYVRYHGENMSRQQLTVKLMQKGINREQILRALEEEYSGDERKQIEVLLRKKNFNPKEADDKEFRRVYGFLMRRGFRSSDILSAMKAEADYD